MAMESKQEKLLQVKFTGADGVKVYKELQKKAIDLDISASEYVRNLIAKDLRLEPFPVMTPAKPKEMPAMDTGAVMDTAGEGVLFENDRYYMKKEIAAIVGRDPASFSPGHSDFKKLENAGIKPNSEGKFLGMLLNRLYGDK